MVFCLICYMGCWFFPNPELVVRAIVARVRDRVCSWHKFMIIICRVGIGTFLVVFSVEV